MPTRLNAVKQAFISLIFYLIIPFFSFSQASLIQWQKCLGGTAGEIPSSAALAADGGYVVVGSNQSTDGDVSGNHGDYDVWVVKTAATGDIVWKKSFGGSSREDGKCIKATPDGGFIITGLSYSSDGDVTANKGASDVWVMKIDGNGTLQWQKNYGGSSYDYGSAIDLTADGGYIVGGSSFSTDGDVTVNHGNTDYWIFKIDQLGNLIWQKSFGGGGIDLISSIIHTSDGNYVAAGSTTSTNGDVTDNHSDGYDSWLIKLDGDGNLLWKKCFGGTGGEEAHDIKESAGGGYIVAGLASSTNGDVVGYRNGYGAEGWIFKLDTAGVIQWQKCFGGTNNDVANFIVPVADGYVIAGSSFSTNGDASGGNGKIWVVHTGSAGDVYEHYRYGGSGTEEGKCILPTQDNGFLLVSSTTSANGDVSGIHGGMFDFWLVKLVPGALPLKLQGFAAQLKDTKTLLQWQTASEINTGYFNIERSGNSKDFTKVGSVKAAGNSSAAVNYSYVDNLPPASLQQPVIYYRLNEVDKNGNSYVSKTIALNTGSKEASLITWPNPVKSQLNVSIANYTGKLKLIIFTIAGKKVKDVDAPNNTAIDIAALPAGVYIISTVVNGVAMQQKFVKK